MSSLRRLTGGFLMSEAGSDFLRRGTMERARGEREREEAGEAGGGERWCMWRGMRMSAAAGRQDVEIRIWSGTELGWCSKGQLLTVPLQ